ncbi:MAG: hypothetical protein BJ554DRAFT_7758 [Olpidium bornovanus]|uniref:Serine/threonine-protein kinase TEL1 n=1 Tax=Olpidium bornovanus TaxID=278681 RepID=A0A8H8DJ45_9FUNG|nr:MAG: hypothetical protein BJ554DRAFT_7758 [Olpidium bornovanus]
MFERKPDFADFALPFLVRCALEEQCAEPRAATAPGTRKVLSENFTDLLLSDATPPEIIQSLLRVIVFLRTQGHRQEDSLSRTEAPGASKARGWLDLDYLCVSAAAARCGAYATALMFLEIWADGRQPRDLGLTRVPVFQSTIAANQSATWQTLLLHIMKSLDDPDGFYGVEAPINFSTLVDRFEHEGNWNKSLCAHEARLAPVTSMLDLPTSAIPRNGACLPTQVGLLRALDKLGHHHVLDGYVDALVANRTSGGILPPELSEFQLEAAWRTSKWGTSLEIPSAIKPSRTLADLGADHGGAGDENCQNCQPGRQNGDIFACLRSLYCEDPGAFETCMDSALMRCYGELRLRNVEVTAQLTITLRALASLVDILDGQQFLSVARGGESIPHLNKLRIIWKARLEALEADSSFSELEPYMAGRSRVLDILRKKLNASAPVDGADVNSVFREHQIKYITLARKSGQLQLASTALHQLKVCQRQGQLAASDANESEISATCDPEVFLQEINLLWSQNEHSTAIRAMKSLLDTACRKETGVVSPLAITRRLHGIILCKTPRFLRNVSCSSRGMRAPQGKWIGQCRTERPHVVAEQYLVKGINLMGADHPCEATESADDPQLSKRHHSLARYSHKQYETVKDSDDHAAAIKLLWHKRAEIDACAEQIAHAKNAKAKAALRHQQSKLEVQYSADREDAQSFINRQQYFLSAAVENYVRCLTFGNSHDMVVFHLCALWFANSDVRQINSLMKQNLRCVALYKFIPLMHQLSARLNTPTDSAAGTREAEFQAVLSELVEKMAQEHPFHTLYQLFALRVGASTGSSKARALMGVSGEDASAGRHQAACAIWNKLAATEKLRRIVPWVEALANAYNELAAFPIPPTSRKEARGPFPVDKRLRIPRLLQSGMRLPVVTVDLPVDPTGTYKEVVWMQSLDSTFRVAGGINRPKIIVCEGSDGKRYTQLVKFNDDLRQDAVMQQVFVVVRDMLRTTLATRQRKLSIRTYKVIPLSSATGVLEWVENTCPIGEWLVSAHKRYDIVGKRISRQQFQTFSASEPTCRFAKGIGREIYHRRTVER